MQWLAENAQALLTIVSCLAVVVVGLMQKAGWIQKQRANELTQGIEESKENIAGALKAVDLKKVMKDGKLDVNEIADIAQRAVKGTVKNRMRNMVRSVADAVHDGAMDVDPDPEKKSRPILRKLGGLIRARIPFLGG